MALGSSVFETDMGWCALAWSGRGVVRGWLPVADQQAIRASVAKRCPEAVEAEPPGFAAEAIAGVTALMADGATDLSGIALDEADVPELHRRVYAIARAIPPGETLTYGDVAGKLGDKTLAREVGRALGLNPFPPIVPCHRILAASGKTGGFSAPGGVETKLRLLNKEKARVTNAPLLFDELPLSARQISAKSQNEQSFWSFVGTNAPSATPSSMCPSRPSTAASARRSKAKASFSPRRLGKWYSPATTWPPRRASTACAYSACWRRRPPSKAPVALE